MDLYFMWLSLVIGTVVAFTQTVDISTLCPLTAAISWGPFN